MSPKPKVAPAGPCLVAVGAVAFIAGVAGRLAGAEGLPLLLQCALLAGLATVLAWQAIRLAAAEPARPDANAGVDPLTGVLGRGAFLDAYAAQLARARQEASPFALFILDLDYFKAINDSHGHAMGDAVLAHVGRILRSELEDAVIGRLGGDEFAFLVAGFGSAGTCERVGTRVIRALRLPVQLGQRVMEIGASIGAAWMPEHSDDGDELMRCADIALYRAKAIGRGTVITFCEDLVLEQQRRTDIQEGLREALRNRELDVHFQPLVGDGGAAIVGAEALLRWRHPVLGDVSPAEFIPIAEETGVIDRLGQFVLERSIEEGLKWPNLMIAVNVSPAQLHTRSFAAFLRKRFAATGFDPGRLCLEITEGLQLESGTEQISLLEQLRDMGVQIALDDFGAGYSSLAYLRDFPLDCIKIDRSFSATIASDPRSGVLVAAIAQMGAALGLTIIAEGVETEDQLTLLTAAGCTIFQGYHFGRPVPAREFGEMLAARRGPPKPVRDVA